MDDLMGFCFFSRAKVLPKRGKTARILSALILRVGAVQDLVTLSSLCTTSLFMVVENCSQPGENATTLSFSPG
jgi:hypothetical protein